MILSRGSWMTRISRAIAAEAGPSGCAFPVPARRGIGGGALGHRGGCHRAVAPRRRRERLRTDCRRSSGQGGAIGLGSRPPARALASVRIAPRPPTGHHRDRSTTVSTPLGRQPEPLENKFEAAERASWTSESGVSTRRRRGPRGLGQGVEAAGWRSRSSEPGVEAQFSRTRWFERGVESNFGRSG